jgi:hypothetical protein
MYAACRDEDQTTKAERVLLQRRGAEKRQGQASKLCTCQFITMMYVNFGWRLKTVHTMALKCADDSAVLCTLLKVCKQQDESSAGN